MKSQVRIELSLAMLMALLSACSPAAVDTEVPPPTPAPTCTATVEADQEEEALSDAEVEAQDVATVDVIKQLAEAYTRGEVSDIGELNAEDLTKFSVDVTEKLSLQRGANPNIYNDEAYLSPKGLKMLKVEDGTTAEQKTIEMFVPISKDAKGNLMYKGPDGDWVTVENSADFDWNMVITNSDDPRIELPTYTDNGINVVARNLDHINPDTNEDDYALVPLIVYNKNLGQIYFEGVSGRGPQTNNILSLLKIETDEAGHSIYGRLVLGIQITSSLYTEGSDKVLMNQA